MTLDQLGEELDELAPGSTLAIGHDLVEHFFPPGVPDVRVLEACGNFAQQHGCRIEPGQNELTFVKDA